MERYGELAGELFAALERSNRFPPNQEVSAAIRGEMAVMRLLQEGGRPMPAGEISRALRMTTSRTAAVLGSLQRKGLLVREADSADKRRVLASLTDSGRRLCASRRRRALEHMTRFLACLGEEDAAHFVRIMKRAQEIDLPPLCEEDIPHPGEGGKGGHP